MPILPFGSSIELTVSYDKNELISGKEGIVWATYEKRQAEIISNARLTLQISSEMLEVHSSIKKLLLIKVATGDEFNEAVDYIWKSDSGLRLKPD
jgi:hypothetical protein